MAHVHPTDEARPWLDLAGFHGSADRCTCSDMQLIHVGCDCLAEQNLPVTCSTCGAFCRTPGEIAVTQCASCIRHGTIEIEIKANRVELRRARGLPDRCADLGSGRRDQAHPQFC